MEVLSFSKIDKWLKSHIEPETKKSNATLKNKNISSKIYIFLI